MNYRKNEHNTYAIYEQLLEAGKRILVYSGDVDNCLPWTGSLQWVELLGATLQPQQPWRPWTLAGGTRVGGYVVEFGENLHFATVRGAGHMVRHCCGDACALPIGMIIGPTLLDRHDSDGGLS